jgi:hypothetical protein
MERGRPEIGSKLNKDAEYVPEREPLVRPISASEPQVDHIDVACKCLAWTALMRLQPKHLGQSESLNPPISGISGDICRPLEFLGGFFRARRLASETLRVQSLGARCGRTRISRGDTGVRSKLGASEIVARSRECNRSHVQSMSEAGGRTPLSRHDHSIRPFGASFIVSPVEPGIAESTFGQAGAVDAESASSSDGPLTELNGSFEIATHKSAVRRDAHSDWIPFVRTRVG